MNPNLMPRRPRRGRRPGAPLARKRVGQAIALWGFITLGLTALIGVFTLWHLARRGRLLRQRTLPPITREMELPRPDDGNAATAPS